MYLGAVAFAYFIPVDILVLEEAIVLVDLFPYGIEVAMWVVGKFLLAMASLELEQDGCYNGYFKNESCHDVLICFE